MYQIILILQWLKESIHKVSHGNSIQSLISSQLTSSLNLLKERNFHPNNSHPKKHPLHQAEESFFLVLNLGIYPIKS